MSKIKLHQDNLGLLCHGNSQKWGRISRKLSNLKKIVSIFLFFLKSSRHFTLQVFRDKMRIAKMGTFFRNFAIFEQNGFPFYQEGSGRNNIIVFFSIRLGNFLRKFSDLRNSSKIKEKITTETRNVQNFRLRRAILVYKSWYSRASRRRRAAAACNGILLYQCGSPYCLFVALFRALHQTFPLYRMMN